ncbi:MAG: patatin-like phospholipase family protein [Steroidobacteraceae bacterium]|jgi:predicted patatin/cPLA2 family phospholipase|nr:patatin-like phospholipase family protein [Steroidobacteraceae bacterium]
MELWRTIVAGAVVAVALQGCGAAAVRPDPLPGSLAADAAVPGIPGVRYWGDVSPPGFDRWLALPDAALAERYAGVMNRSHEYLLLSGGGAQGAFGAGLLVGWTASGSRPDFEVVTGVSTGALIAPFAFLGPDYDQVLEEAYTSLSTEDLVERRGLLQIVRGDAAADTRRLRAVIARYLDDAAIGAIAAEGRKGRSLLVGTTNLDAGRPVIWDITAIAASGSPRAAELIRDVVLASTSIPGAFPPVLIEVEAGGRRYTEMHVDGGVASQVFLGPSALDWRAIAERLGVQGTPRLFVIRNGWLERAWETTEPRLVPILNRTISTLIHSQSLGDLAKIYLVSRRDGLDFNLAHVPDTFTEEPQEVFDVDYMRKLFALGRSMAESGFPWARERLEPGSTGSP